MSSNDSDADDNKDYNNPLGYDNSTGGGSDNESSSYNEKSPPERWILVIAMAILAFGIILLTLRSVIFSLIFVTIGISLFAYWLYVGVRAREQNRILTTVSGVNKQERVCTCPICKHTESNACLETRCPCCILTRNKQIIGHFNNPLQ